MADEEPLPQGRKAIVSQLLETDASQIPERHRVDRKRVLGILERIVRDNAGDPPPDAVARRIGEHGIAA